jgi:(p)ppGpp synthase/HD superfamily hydrolase
MERETFEQICRTDKPIIDKLLKSAWKLHEQVNETYGHGLPYGFHLMMVEAYVTKYGHLVAQNRHDVLVLYASACFHDTLEDTRITYHDLTHILEDINDSLENNPLDVSLICEDVFALTNNRGRSREERADASYYKLISQTTFATFLKMCDRMANFRYSCLFNVRTRMCNVYEKEMKHFIKAITDDAVTPLPQQMLDEMTQMLAEAKDMMRF